ncbi:unnamed protein product [Rotaria magnacalcarata]|uniref:Uncharacterized protein n=1 Tax=Rotaria magnacalcarata TaxID=392030 RepID=A0A815LPW9_9BILA|nr:unnamed protein product [Rotaria magnacalcarata]
MNSQQFFAYVEKEYTKDFATFLCDDLTIMNQRVFMNMSLGEIVEMSRTIFPSVRETSIKFYVVDANNQDSRKGLKASTITTIKILKKDFAAARNKRSGDLSTTETTEAELNNDSSKENRRKKARTDTSTDRLSQKRLCRQSRRTIACLHSSLTSSSSSSSSSCGMRRGINDNYRYNKKGSSSSNLKLSNISFNEIPKSIQQTTVSAFEASGTYNLEEMIAIIRQNPNVAFGVHEHLTHHTHSHPINVSAQSSTPQTPKRILDSSDNDGAQISKQQRVLSNGKQKKTREMNFSKVPSPVHQMNNNLQLDQPRQQASVQQQHRIPFEQLKRAVSSNLPCFFIEYEHAENSKNRPSDISAARVIEDYFKQQGISISFSLVGHTGNKLKFGVNNKNSYATLINTDKWPSQIHNINITVSKPKFIPKSFALVVRYVPLQYDDEFVKEEIKRNLQSVENIRHIQYRFQRRTNDFRFVIKDLDEYNSTLKLGRISIGNTFCIITPFLTGNRMTYCTRCWCLSHMRDKCNGEYSRCRICLDNRINGQTHVCSNTVRCAQCDKDHHSLSSACEKVVEYRSNLKEQVENALSAGKVQRLVPQDHVQPTEFRLKQNEFPSLPSLMSCNTPWKQTSVQSTVTNNINGIEDTTKILLSINQNILDMKDNTRHIDEKLDCINEKVNRTSLDVELHNEILVKLLPTLASLVDKFIWPMIVQGWGFRSLEVIDIVYKIEASICVFTEVGELWNTSQIPHFNIFHQHGTNKSGGVSIAIGKHLKGSRIDSNIENAIIVDVDDLSETVRIIAIYWPAGQTRVLGELESYITKNTIITCDFNASVK